MESAYSFLFLSSALLNPKQNPKVLLLAGHSEGGNKGQKKFKISLSTTLTSKDLKGRISGDFLKVWGFFFCFSSFFFPSFLPQIWFYSFSSSFLTSENRHVSPKGTIKCVFFQNLKGMVSRLCVQQATLINGTHPAYHCWPNCNLHQ